MGLTNQERSNRRRTWILGAILSVAVIALVASSLIYRIQFGPTLSTDQSVWGTFGDFMGGVLNPILSFLALGALLWTINLQVEELQETREEAKGSRIALQSQLFEGQFSSMLRIFSDSVQAMRTVDWKGEHHFGTGCFRSWVDEFRLGLADNDWLFVGGNQIQHRWDRLLRAYSSDLGPFLQKIEAILSVIARRPALAELPEISHYIRVFRSSLTEEQLRLIWLWRHLSLAEVTPELDLLLGQELAEKGPLVKSPSLGVRGALMRDEGTGKAFLASNDDDHRFISLNPEPSGDYPRMVTALFDRKELAAKGLMSGHVEEVSFDCLRGMLSKPRGYKDRVYFTWNKRRMRIVPCTREVYALLRDMPETTDSGNDGLVFYRHTTDSQIEAMSIVVLIRSLDLARQHYSSLYTKTVQGRPTTPDATQVDSSRPEDEVEPDCDDNS